MWRVFAPLLTDSNYNFNKSTRFVDHRCKPDRHGLIIFDNNNKNNSSDQSDLCHATYEIYRQLIYFNVMFLVRYMHLFQLCIYKYVVW